MASAAPLQMRWGVTVCMPSGIALVTIAAPCVCGSLVGLERDVYPAPVFSFEHDLSGKPASTFPDRAREEFPDTPASGRGLRRRRSGSAAPWQRRSRLAARIA